MIARLEVTRGYLTEYPLAEKVRGGWQNGVTFYPDAEVTKVTPLHVQAPHTPTDTAHRLSLFLDEVTGGLLSKSTYAVADMVQATDERYARLRDEAIAEALSDAAEPQGEPSDAQVDAAARVLYDQATALQPNAWATEDEVERDVWRRDVRAILRAAAVTEQGENHG
jgi:hypothetical protein